jgi:hypothetical protein
VQNPWVTSCHRFGNAGGDWTENSSDAQIIVTETSAFSAAGTGYEYRSFSLQGSSGLTGKGFSRMSAEETSP